MRGTCNFQQRDKIEMDHSHRNRDEKNQNLFMKYLINVI